MKWRYRLGTVAGNALEYYDIAVFAAISVYLSAELERLGYESATEMVWGIFALRFLARPIGGYIIDYRTLCGQSRKTIGADINQPDNRYCNVMYGVTSG